MEEIVLCCRGEADCQKRLDVWLAEELSDYTRSFVQRLITDGQVLVNGESSKAKQKLKLGDEVAVRIPEPVALEAVPQDIPLDIVYEDQDIIVINKPKNMVVHPAAGNPDGTLVDALLYHCGDSLSDINGIIRPGMVHRIDKDTTGLLCVAKNNQAHVHLAAQLKDHSMRRTYMALVDKVITENSGVIDAPIGRHPVDRKKMAVNLKSGREAVTHFRVVERFSNCTLVELSLETGRTHQIRVHMSYIGHPVCGDEVYGRKFSNYETQGQMLHAFQLELTHPRTEERMTFHADVPGYFQEIVGKISK